MHKFLKFIFGIELYMFRTVSLFIIRSPSTVHTAIHTDYADCLLASSQRNLYDIYLLLYPTPSVTNSATEDDSNTDHSLGLLDRVDETQRSFETSVTCSPIDTATYLAAPLWEPPLPHLLLRQDPRFLISTLSPWTEFVKVVLVGLSWRYLCGLPRVIKSESSPAGLTGLNREISRSY